MTLRLQWSAKSRLDIIDAAEFIERDNPDAAYRFVGAVEKAGQSLLEQPLRGAKRVFENPRLNEVRAISVPGFRRWLVFYRPRSNTVMVLRVLHGMRNVASIMADE